MSMNSRLPAPAYGYGGKRTESRRIEGPGRSEYIITHRHGSEYQKQSVFASGQPQSLPSSYKGHGPEQEAYFHAPPPRPQIQHGYDQMLHMSPASPGGYAQFHHIQPGDHGHPPGFDQHGHHGHGQSELAGGQPQFMPRIIPIRPPRTSHYPTPPLPPKFAYPSHHLQVDRHSHHSDDDILVARGGPELSEASSAKKLSDIQEESRSREDKDHTMSISAPSKVSSRDVSDMDQRWSRGLTFGISLARSISDKNSSVSLTQTSETRLGLDGVKGSKNIIEGDYKAYKESIFSVSSSRYTGPLSPRMCSQSTSSLHPRMSIGAELVLQPPARPTEKGLSPLLTWM